mmetsp:Transcript_148340/g.369780  ORF Transcript_148340/g.369780 Transcript_148340/m.369780 type:complete len:244 (-) Transcript_148340:238-969(-)
MRLPCLLVAPLGGHHDLLARGLALGGGGARGVADGLFHGAVAGVSHRSPAHVLRSCWRDRGAVFAHGWGVGRRSCRAGEAAVVDSLEDLTAMVSGGIAAWHHLDPRLDRLHGRAHADQHSENSEHSPSERRYIWHLQRHPAAHAHCGVGYVFVLRVGCLRLLALCKESVFFDRDPFLFLHCTDDPLLYGKDALPGVSVGHLGSVCGSGTELQDIVECTDRHCLDCGFSASRCLGSLVVVQGGQ